ncbi:predicted protein [Uncinocarpus reesii 1704]|uniref:Uncharacterized protein n=1 Tax=Uncinocarpus reesii (strain UAMH 1704) TaxID=336963 RepID=C4JEH0_UNCRE|nr:uncharacterized protein UREG_00809 [Uncinocarpus reesii 1704]EEP75962.1 predicted protein [Uncinocarpus reesii 1704]
MPKGKKVKFGLMQRPRVRQGCDRISLFEPTGNFLKGFLVVDTLAGFDSTEFTREGNVQRARWKASNQSG